jgi:predicted RNA-binding Zn-ribbon protein involved in translation (DUF1610 family)
MADKTFRLTVVTKPANVLAIQAPPPIVAAENSNNYLCGNCGTLLVMAETDQLSGLVVLCRKCGAYNAVDT